MKEIKNEDVDVVIYEDKLSIMYKGQTLRITREVLQDVINTIENHDAIGIQEATERARIVEVETIISFIELSNPVYPDPERDYSRDNACAMLEDWDIMSDLHKMGIINWCKKTFKLGFLDLSAVDVREAVFNKIVLF